MPENHEKSEVISDGPTDRHSELKSRVHATKNGNAPYQYNEQCSLSTYIDCQTRLLISYYLCVNFRT